ncbi:unnamed protein product [Kuraishia capsulata CBS 1993]|uniref:Na(+)/H(+) antiporter n=1 Tax=Kuraishia capsulata CBS 1993 TaxID=1382522 RepID=W6MF28_9ASCO|nr:uncharacterized protein KUCA_T00000124001 [Kuraishia capsulata CBS 1993]CDK24164.1 unnamed protein product [Kuraishia capsulata CBS 1993]
MAVWEHLNVDKAHVAYACVGVFSTCFSLCSLFIKEKLYVGEATVASIFGLIVGPHCLNWFAPTTWGNSDYITLEISRMVLIIQIFAVAVELPKKYMLKHWVSVFVFLVPVMTVGWLMVGLFVWILIPGLNFSESLLVASCVTATDPVLAAAVVGKGKFAKRVPGHLRNILSAESGCNDGMAFPFIYLAMNLIIHSGHAGEIIKDWICVTILYECILGCVIGAFIGWVGRHAIRFAESKDLIDRESFLAFYVVLSFVCAGFGSILGVDDLLVSFAAGTAFAWDGWFAQKTEESHVSTVIDLLLNLAYFVYFGAIVPWEKYNDGSLGLDDWRLVLLAIVVIFLRRIPAVLALKPLTPDVKNWKEALFCGHFGPIGVGAVYAVILAKSELEDDETGKRGPLKTLPGIGTKYYQLLEVLWPIVSFLVIISIVVHGSSVAVLTLGRHLQSMTFTLTMTHTEGSHQGWVSRLPKLDSTGRSMSLHRIDTMATSEPTLQNSAENGLAGRLSSAPTIETSGVPARPAGGMRRRRKKRGLKHRGEKYAEHRERPVTESLDLRQLQRNRESAMDVQVPQIEVESPKSETFNKEESASASSETARPKIQYNEQDVEYDEDGDVRIPTMGYDEGNELVIEDQHGEIMSELSEDSERDESNSQPSSSRVNDLRKRESSPSIHSFASLEKHMTRLSRAPSHEEPKKREKLMGMKKLVSGKTKSGSQNKIDMTKPSTSTGKQTKYFGYRIDNQIIIEDGEGEIIRRYRINTHSGGDDSPMKPRPRSNSTGGLRNRALTFVGFRPKAEKDVEHAEATNNMFIPDASNQEGDGIPNDKELEKKLTGFLTVPESRQVSSEEESDSYEGTTDDDEDEDDDSSEEGGLAHRAVAGESEYERARRLAALDVSERLDDDEEDIPKSSRN